MRRDMQDKMADQADQVIKIPVKTCPHCGLPQAPWRCREVAKGYWCQAAGLFEDTSRTMMPTPVDPIKEAAEQDREVKNALAAYQRATAADEQATAAFEAAALAHYRAKQRRYADGQTIYSVDGMPFTVAPPGASDADMQRLSAAQDQANTLREHAAMQAIKARQQLDAARARARRKLSRVAV
jgi:hypothetical protein